VLPLLKLQRFQGFLNSLGSVQVKGDEELRISVIAKISGSQTTPPPKLSMLAMIVSLRACASGLIGFIPRHNAYGEPPPKAGAGHERTL
jgi:hypothetical protein